MHVLPWSDNSIPEVDEDDPARRITFFKKREIGLSYKCPKLNLENEQWERFEYGFYKGNILIEAALEVIQIDVCETFIKILEQSSNPHIIVARIFKENT